MIYNLYKPRGISSNRFLRFFQKKFGFAKAGFVGTLDPLAEGVLPVFVGSSTRLIPFLKPLYKTYFFRLGFFYRSRSLDGEGYLTYHPPQPSFGSAQARHQELTRLSAEAKAFFLAQTEQTIPSFSAKKIAGKRLYHLARKGIALEENLTKKVAVQKIDFLAVENTKASSLSGRITVSPGFFVRSLAQDFAQLAGVDCYLESLVREEVGGIFRLDQALQIQDLFATETAQNLPQLELKKIFPDRFFLRLTDPEQIRRLRQGQKISLGSVLCLFYQGEQITLDCRDFSTYIQTIDRDVPWEKAEVLVEDTAENLIALGFFSTAEEDPFKPNRGSWLFAPKIVF